MEESLILNLKRLKSGIITGIKGQQYVPKKQIASMIKEKEIFKIIESTTGLDITEKVIAPIIKKLAKEEGLKNKFTNRMTKDDFPHATEEEVKEKIKSVYTNREINYEFNFVDLFCGAGGLSVGLEKSGMKCVLGSDINTYAMQAFRNHHKSTESFCRPISSLTNEVLKEKLGNKKVDLVCGGPPCQGFSTIGRGKADDQRNKLFKEFIRVVRTLNPTYILFENVAGLLAKKNKETLHAILASFEALDYRIKIKVLQSQHYGIPQRRKRTIILGCKENYKFEHPLPIFDCVENGKYVRPSNLGDVIDEIYNEDGLAINHDEKKATPLSRLTLDRISHIPEGRGIRYQRDEDELLPDELKLDVDWKTIREGRLRELRYYRLSRNLPAPTINTSNEQYFHPTKSRKLTVRELARIQTFPNEFEFFGNIQNQKKLVGNAVPVLMGKAIGESILQSFEDKTPDLNKNEDFDLSEEIGKGFYYSKYLS